MLVALLLGAIVLSASELISLRKSYTIWCTGNCNQDVNSSTLPGIVLMGGGTDTTEAFDWQIGNANGGDFVVMRTSGDDAYDEWIYEISIASGKRLNSVRTILWNSKDASEEDEVLTILHQAEAIFFAGGDQSVYIDYWMNTPVQDIIQSKVSTITIGGTSAGLAILGNWIYSGEKGSIESDTAMMDPYHKWVTIVPKFLTIPYLDAIITDTHFVTRDRMGRLITFMSRIMMDHTVMNVIGVGVDEHTALLLNITTGKMDIVGVNTAYICQSTHIPDVCVDTSPLTMTDVSCVRMNALSHDIYDISTMTPITTSCVQYINNIINGSYTNNPYGIPV